MTAQGGSSWTVDIGGNNTRSRKADGIEDWDWDRGAAPHCHFDRSEVEWRNLPVILWLVAGGWENHTTTLTGGGKAAPFGGWRHHLPIGGSVSLDSQSTASPYESSSLATRGSVGRQKESAFMGRLGALLRPTCTSYAGCAQWDYGYSALCCMIRMEV